MGAAAYPPIFEIAALASFAVAYFAWRRRPAPGAFGLALWSASTGAWALAYVVQLMFTDRSPSIVWLGVRAMCLAGAVAGFLILATEHVGRGGWIARRFAWALLVVPSTTLLLIVAPPLRNLYIGSVEPTMRVVQGGPWFSFTVIYHCGLIFIAVLLLLIDLSAKRGLYQLQTAILLASIAIPGVVMGLELGGYSFMPGVNATPVAFGLSCVVVAFGLFRLGLLDVVPVARDRVIDEMPMGMAVFDRDSKLIDINTAAARLLLSETGTLGMRADQVFAGLGDQGHHLKRLVQAGEGCADVHVAGQVGRSLQAVVSEVRDRQGQRAATVMLLSDITERVTQERLRREFVANASHELQTPLADLSLLGSTLEHVARSDPDQLEPFLGVLRHETERLVHMTRGLLTLSHVDEAAESARYRWSTVDIADIIRTEVAHCQPAASAHGLALDLDVPAAAPVTGEGQGLAAVVGNLLENAIRYSDPGGRIQVVLETDAETRELILTVEDEGIGIGAQDQQRIFERFYRVDKARSRETGGSGLGLSIVKSIVEQHGGEVLVRSEPGVGSTFEVRLPASP